MRTFALRKSTITKAAGLIMVASAATLAASGSASAAGIYTATTTDSGAHGGQASFNTQTDVLKVCDTQADGLRAYGQIGYYDSNSNWLGSHTDAAGGNGTCVSINTESLKTGVKFTVTACLKNGANGALQYCKNVNGTE